MEAEKDFVPNSLDFLEEYLEKTRREQEMREEEKEKWLILERNAPLEIKMEQELFEFCFQRLNIGLSKSEMKEEEVLIVLLDYFLVEFEKSWGSWLIFLQVFHRFNYLSEMNYNFLYGGFDVVEENRKAMRSLCKKTLSRLSDLELFVESKGRLDAGCYRGFSWQQIGRFLSHENESSMLHHNYATSGRNSPIGEVEKTFPKVEIEDQITLDQEGNNNEEKKAERREEKLFGSKSWSETEWESYIMCPIKLLIRLISRIERELC